MTKARDLANLISTGNPLADGALAASEVSGLHAVATSGAYANLTGTPTLATVATSGAYADVTGTPSLATVATSGAYSDLSGSPSGDSLLPSQSGNTGKFLTSNGSAASWADAGGGAYELITKTTISSNASEIIFDSVSAPQQQLLLLINGLQVNNSGSIIFHYRNSSGGNLNNTGGSSDTYRNTGHYSILNSAIGYSGNSTGNGIYIGYSQTYPSKDFNASFRIFNFGTTATGLQGTSSQMASSSTGFQSQDINSQAATSAATAGIRLYITNSREFTSGEVYLYKLV